MQREKCCRGGSRNHLQLLVEEARVVVDLGGRHRGNLHALFPVPPQLLDELEPDQRHTCGGRNNDYYFTALCTVSKEEGRTMERAHVEKLSRERGQQGAWRGGLEVQGRDGARHKLALAVEQILERRSW